MRGSARPPAKVRRCYSRTRCVGRRSSKKPPATGAALARCVHAWEATPHPPACSHGFVAASSHRPPPSYRLPPHVATSHIKMSSHRVPTLVLSINASPASDERVAVLLPDGRIVPTAPPDRPVADYIIASACLRLRRPCARDADAAGASLARGKGRAAPRRYEA